MLLYDSFVGAFIVYLNAVPDRRNMVVGCRALIPGMWPRL